MHNVADRGVLDLEAMWQELNCGQSWTPWSTHYLLTTPIWCMVIVYQIFNVRHARSHVLDVV